MNEVLRRKHRAIGFYLIYDSLICGSQRDTWVHELLKGRDERSEFVLAEQILDSNDEEKCHQYFGMTREQFGFLFSLVEPAIKKKDTFWRLAIPAKQRLIVTLRYLATGCSQIHISFSFRIGHSTVGEILRETLSALWDTLLPIVLTPPNGPKWLEVAQDFFNLWQLPNCIGSLDGKHVKIRAPPNSGSEFFNYKGHFSIVLLAICDAHYRFLLVDIGDSGRHSDGGVFSNSRIGKAFNDSTLGIPGPQPLPGSTVTIPLFFAADDAFPLRVGIIKPFSGRMLSDGHQIFNYRLSRGRRTVENAFGILAARWQFYLKTVNADPDLADKMIQASVVLHNFLQAPNARAQAYGDQVMSNGRVLDGRWRQVVSSSVNLHPLAASRSNNYSRSAAQFREELKSFFLTAGAVPWQWQDHS